MVNQNFALIVDEDPSMRRIHKLLLNRFGFQTSTVGDGKRAVNLFKSGAHFDLVLMDMEMPNMDGPQATRELRAMGVNSKIIGVTAHGLDSEFMEAGLNACYRKPLSSNAVVSICEELMKET